MLFDSKLTFVKHIQTVVASVKGALGFVKRTPKNKFTIASAKMLYYALVRSKLEFASVVWQPFHDIYIRKIESVQKDFVIWSLRTVYQSIGVYVLNMKMKQHLLILVVYFIEFLV